LSQKGAAELAQVTAATWCDWEKGKKLPDGGAVFDLERITSGLVTAEQISELIKQRRLARSA
jgi:hypothetical protein